MTLRFRAPLGPVLDVDAYRVEVSGGRTFVFAEPTGRVTMPGNGTYSADVVGDFGEVTGD